MSAIHSSAAVKKQLLLFFAFLLPLLALFTLLFAASYNTMMLTLLMFTPALSVIAVNLITHDQRTLFLKLRFKNNRRHYLLSWFVPPLLAGIGALIYFLIWPADFQPLASAFAAKLGVHELQPYLSQLFPSVLLAMVINPFGGLLPALGEELAWRGWLLPRLADICSERRAALITSLIWGLWHAPVIALGYNYGPEQPWLGIFGQLWLCLAQGMILAWLQLRSKSVWTSALWHGSLNGIDMYSAGILFTDGAASALIGPNLTGLVGGIGFAVFALWCYKRLSAQPADNPLGG